ncbi:MAG: ABC transporter substrate-binding protein [Rhodospirillales bacterium]|nr:ABC transporter substrate-binding protein [Rhodospirillales bacterium]
MFLRRILTATLAVVLAAFVSAQTVTAADIDSGAKKFIEGLADKAIQSLTDQKSSREQREARFRELLNKHFAVDVIGQWVLGRYWRQATKLEQSEYLELFENLIVVTYLDRFVDYSGETLTVTKTVINESRDIVVFSVITRKESSQTPIQVDWRVRLKDGTYKIVDVMVEGISMGQTQRSEFGSVIRKNGGKIEGLLSELRKKVKKNA